MFPGARFAGGSADAEGNLGERIRRRRNCTIYGYCGRERRRRSEIFSPGVLSLSLSAPAARRPSVCERAILEHSRTPREARLCFAFLNSTRIRRDRVVGNDRRGGITSRRFRALIPRCVAVTLDVNHVRVRVESFSFSLIIYDIYASRHFEVPTCAYTCRIVLLLAR